jgi:hypothetical protein
MPQTWTDGLARFVPSAGKSQLIITSSQLETGGLGEVVAVGVFTEQEAASFLAQRTGRSDDAAARELAGELGFLPLALAQAAAVIAAQHLDYQSYLTRLRAIPVQDLLKRVTGEPYRTAPPRRSCWLCTPWQTATGPACAGG